MSACAGTPNGGETPAEAVAAGAGASGQGNSEIPAFAAEEEMRTPEVEITADADVEDGNIEISSVPPGAEVRINGRVEGRTPLTKQLSTGSYRITVTAEGYREHSKWISLWRDEEIRVQFRLSRITGIFDPQVSPSGAVITVGEKKIGELPAQLPEGTYRIRISLFGYRPWEKTVRIRAGEVSAPRVELEPAEPGINALSASPDRFNPWIGGPKGSSQVEFSVTAPAQTVIRLFDASGDIIEERRVSATDSPRHRIRIPSTAAAERRLLGDVEEAARAGRSITVYRVELSADFTDGPSLTRETELRVDSTLRPAFHNSPSGMYGTLLCPLPAPEEDGTQVSFTPSMFYDHTVEDYTDQFRFPTAIHLSRQTGRGYAYAGAIGVDIREKVDDELFAGAELQKNLLAERLPRFFSLSASMYGGYLGSHRRRSLQPRTGALLSFPLRLDAGPLGLALAPRGGLLYEEGRDAPAGRYGAAAAVLVEGGSATLALSASIEQDSYRPEEPVLEAAAESRFIIPGTDFALSAYAGVDLSDAPKGYSAGAGVGSTIFR